MAEVCSRGIVLVFHKTGEEDETYRVVIFACVCLFVCTFCVLCVCACLGPCKVQVYANRILEIAKLMRSTAD